MQRQSDSKQTTFSNLVCFTVFIAGVAVTPTVAQGYEAAASCPRVSRPGDVEQNFDGATPPALPTDWLATNALGPPPLWVTSNSGVPVPPADITASAAFIDDPAVVSDKRLDSLHFPLAAASAQLTFQQNLNLEASGVDPNLGFDGGVLEVSFDGGNTFQDILAAGGSFVTGGYNRPVATDRGSPLAGRQAWSSNWRASSRLSSTCHSCPQVAPASLSEMASDSSGSGEGLAS